MEVELGFPTDLSILSNPIVVLVLGLIFLILFFIIGLNVYRRFTLSHGKVDFALKKKILHITVPKATGKEQTEPPSMQQVQEKIGVAETLYSTIAGLKAEKGFKTWLWGNADVFSLEVVVIKGKIHFFIVTPQHMQQYIEEQINAQYPAAFIEEIPDYNIFSPKCFIGAKNLKFTREYIFPVKTYKKFDSDPLNSFLNALSKIDEKDGAAIQIIIKSAPAKWHDFGAKVASKMHQGKKIDEAIKEVRGGAANFATGLLKSAKTKDPNQPQEQYKLTSMEEEVVKNIEEKSSKSGVDANIRIVVASENKVKIDQYLNNLSNAFTAFNVPKYGNSFKPIGKKLDAMVRDFIYRNYDESMGIVLNTEELASLFHFPIPQVNETPNILWLQAKKAPAPSNVGTEGLLMGQSEYRGRITPIYLKKEDRVRHMYVIGMTGTGKTYYMSGLTMQDIMNGDGCCFIDPHGSDIEEILKRVPKERAEDVIFFDPTDVDRPIALNMLEYDNPEQKTFVVNEVMSIFDKLYDLKATGGPMFEQYFKNACYLIMDDPESGSTLMEIPRVLADDDFRKMKLSKCKSQPVKDFWEKEALKAGGEASLQNMVPYITSKLAPFIANDMMRPIISQQKSSIDFREAMDKKKIVLVKLSKGKIGEINAHLLGMIIVGKIQMAALSRVDMPAEERNDFYLYIDEFQNVLTDSIESILSEARKYRLSLTIGHQYIGQLVKGGDTKFKDAIFGNVGTKVAFRIGVDDSEYMAKEFSPVFGEYDFMNVPKFNCFVKLLVDNANPPAFSMATFPHEKLPVAPDNAELAKAIKELSRLKYGKDRKIIEMEVNERLKRTQA